MRWRLNWPKHTHEINSSLFGNEWHERGSAFPVLITLFCSKCEIVMKRTKRIAIGCWVYLTKSILLMGLAKVLKIYIGNSRIDYHKLEVCLIIMLTAMPMIKGWDDGQPTERRWFSEDEIFSKSKFPIGASFAQLDFMSQADMQWRK
jgi:hypothetical protein